MRIITPAYVNISKVQVFIIDIQVDIDLDFQYLPPHDSNGFGRSNDA